MIGTFLPGASPSYSTGAVKLSKITAAGVDDDGDGGGSQVPHTGVPDLSHPVVKTALTSSVLPCWAISQSLN